MLQELQVQQNDYAFGDPMEIEYDEWIPVEDIKNIRSKNV